MPNAVTTVVFEVAAFADSIAKAARIAPKATGTVGETAGIMIDIEPQNLDSPITIRATDIAIFYTEWLDSLSIDGPATNWRIPSGLLQAFVSSLPIGSGRNLTLFNDGNQLRIESGRAKAKFNLINLTEYPYPNWGTFNENSMTDVPNFGERLKQVEWAASKNEVALGVHLDGEHLIATDRYRFARVPLKIEGMVQPVTIPPKVLTGILKNVGDTKIKIEKRAFLITPDEHSQVRTVIIDMPFPNAKNLYEREYDQTITVEKDNLLTIISRVANMKTKNPFPVMKMIIGRGELACMISDDELGAIQDVLELPGQCEHVRTEIMIGPNFIREGLANAPSSQVRFSYTPWEGDLKYAPPVLIDGGSGYKCWIMQRAEPESAGS